MPTITRLSHLFVIVLQDWMKYVVYNDPSFNYSQFGLADIALAQALDPGNVSTFSGNFSAFRSRGGKLLTYHGRVDDVRHSRLIICLPTSFDR